MRMVSLRTLSPPPNVTAAALEARRRVGLARQVVDELPARPSRRLLLGEFTQVAERLQRVFRCVDLPKAATPQTVMILPGFATHPVRMRYMARQLERAGHRTKRWGQGFNLGASRERLDLLEERLLDLVDRYDSPVVLLGWSLGGLFARELAKRQPAAVAKVITMGSPFSGDPRANNVWRLYQLVAGHAVDEPPIDHAVGVKPPVETVALWSPRDGIVAARSACGTAHERDRAIALRCTHMGFAYSDEAIRAVARELDSR